MKITDLKTKILFKPNKKEVFDAARPVVGRDVLLIEVETNENIKGIGFLTGMCVAHGSEIHILNEIIIKSLKPTLIGKDPLRIDALWQEMYKLTTRFGRKGAVVRAISGVDIALWDLLGKKANIPLYKLLGGNKKKVKVYASGGFYHSENDLENVTEEMNSYVLDGFKAVKMKVGKDPKYDVQRVKAVREVIGDNIDLLIDANEAWDFNTAYWFVRNVEQYNIFWIEEPVIPDDMQGYIQLTDKSPIPIAAGENEYTKFGFRDMIINNAVNILMPDVTRVGGITEWMKVSSMAEAFCMNCFPHAVNEIHISLAAAVANTPMMEYFTNEHQLQVFLTELFTEPITVKNPKDGYIYVPEAPGLGIKFNEEVVEKYTVSSNL